MQISDFSKHIHQLYRDGKYEEALNYFEENKHLFSIEQISNDKYLVSIILYTFRKSHKIDKAFKFLKDCEIVINLDTDERILNPYGWILYSKFKLENSLEDKADYEEESNDEISDEEEYAESQYEYNYDKSEIIKRIESFLPLIIRFISDSDYAYNVFTYLFRVVIKTEGRKANANWKLIIDLCDLVKPESLKTDCNKFEAVIKGRKKEIELASDREFWFANKSRALFKLANKSKDSEKSSIFQECYNISKQALESLKNSIIQTIFGLLEELLYQRSI
jgi:hypothetical protein